jgi:hypothetical protein
VAAANPSLTESERYKILRGNAERLFEFTPAALPKSDALAVANGSTTSSN